MSNMTPKTVSVYAPATISNIGPGFDVLGLAIDQPGDNVTAERLPKKGLLFTTPNPASAIPNDHTNVAAHVAQLMLTEYDPPFGVALTLHKNMPLGSGLGSSGASCAAAALAVNALLPQPLSKKELIRFAIEGEKLACGSPHADNVAPSLLGGICLIRSYTPLDVIQLPYQNNFFWVVAHPNLVILTQQARDMLPKTLPLAAAVEQCGNCAALVTGLNLGNAALIATSLHDVVAEPVRAALIPGYADIKEAALHAGAIAFSISGSGPSVFAITTSLDIANNVAAAIKLAFSQFTNVNSKTYISKINPTGAKIIEENT